MPSHEIKENFIRLRAQGKSLRVIAEELHVAGDTIHQWNRECEDDILAARRDELEAVLEDSGAGRRERINGLARAFHKVEAYLERSDAIRSDIKSYQLIMKLDEYLNLENLTAGQTEESVEDETPEQVTVFTSIPIPRDSPNVRYQTEEEMKQLKESREKRERERRPKETVDSPT